MVLTIGVQRTQAALARVAVRLDWLGCRFILHIPGWKNQHGGVDLERASEYLCAFDTQVDPIALDRGDRGLGNPGECSELILAEFLEFTDDSHGLANRNFDPLVGLSVVAHDHFFL